MNANRKFRVVLDTNVLLAGIVSSSSASQRVVDALNARRAVPLLSKGILHEYRTTLLHAATLGRFPNLTKERIDATIRSLRYVGDTYAKVECAFTFSRDPNDAKFLALAIAAVATHIVTYDADMISLTRGHNDATSRFRRFARHVRIVRPGAFLRELENAQ